MFNTDSWLWKIALVLALVGVREFVRLMDGGPGAVRQKALNEAAAQPGGVHSVRVDKIEGGESENARWLIETLDSAAIAIGLVLFVVQPFLLQAFWIPSSSMEDTLRIDDRLLVSKFVYRVRAPRSGDVVVFRPPQRANAKPGDDFIKRCIGAPGDVIFAQNRQYYRQAPGQKRATLMNEPYVKWGNPTSSYDMKIVDGKVYSREKNPFSPVAPWVEQGPDPIPMRPPHPRQEYIENAPPEAVPGGMFLMLGDHRDNSNDSHAWGLVPRENIVGKAFCVFWPPARIGVIDRMSRFPRPPMAAPTRQLSPIAQ